MERLQQETFRQLHLELNKSSEEHNTKYIALLIPQIRHNNIHLCQLGVGMPIIARMRQNNEIRNQKILKLVNYNNRLSTLISPEDINHLEEIDVDTIIKNREEEFKVAEEKFEKLKEDFVYQTNNLLVFILINPTIAQLLCALDIIKTTRHIKL